MCDISDIGFTAGEKQEDEPQQYAQPRIFNGIITITNAKGEHRTFRIHTVKKGGLIGKRLLSLLTGPDNTSNYRSFGFVDEDGVRVWSQHRNDKMKLWYAELVAVLVGKFEPTTDLGRKIDASKYEVLHEGRCVRCNRKLTHPESIKSGIGPECAGKWGK